MASGGRGVCGLMDEGWGRLGLGGFDGGGLGLALGSMSMSTKFL